MNKEDAKVSVLESFKVIDSFEREKLLDLYHPITDGVRSQSGKTKSIKPSLNDSILLLKWYEAQLSVQTSVKTLIMRNIIEQEGAFNVITKDEYKALLENFEDEFITCLRNKYNGISQENVRIVNTEGFNEEKIKELIEKNQKLDNDLNVARNALQTKIIEAERSKNEFELLQSKMEVQEKTNEALSLENERLIAELLKTKSTLEKVQAELLVERNKSVVTTFATQKPEETSSEPTNRALEITSKNDVENQIETVTSVQNEKELMTTPPIMVNEKKTNPSNNEKQNTTSEKATKRIIVRNQAVSNPEVVSIAKDAVETQAKSEVPKEVVVKAEKQDEIESVQFSEKVESGVEKAPVTEKATIPLSPPINKAEKKVQKGLGKLF